MFQLVKNVTCATPSLAFACVAAMSLQSFPALAAQVSGQFNATVTLVPAPAKPSVPVVPPVVTPVQPVIAPPGLPVSAFCTRDNLPNANGAVVTVVCTTGTVVGASTADNAFSLKNGGSYRYVTQVSPNADLNDTSSTFSGAGTTTAWRVVHHSGRDYLEMTLGW